MKVSLVHSDYHTFDFDEHINQIFVSNLDTTEIVVEEYVSKNMEFVHEEKQEKENVFESIIPNPTSVKFFAIDEEEVPDIPFEETPKAQDEESLWFS